MRDLHGASMARIRPEVSGVPPLATVRRRLVLGATVAAVLLFLRGFGMAHASSSRCFGAAARNAAHPCANAEQSLAVIPTPSEAQIVPNAPCSPIDVSLNVCGFGVPAARARGTIGLVGNSHAGHWRAALEVVARGLDWHGISITRSSCPFMQATIDLSEPKRSECREWHQGVIEWFYRHPEVSTVFVSDQPTPPVPRRGQSVLAAQIGGYIAAWHELPATIRHIIVIRDNPYANGATLACVQQAIERRQPAGLRCALPRSRAVKPDPAALAAYRLRSPRVRVIDLTRLFCDSSLCYPVIGGALVYRDPDHLTRVFAATLGPSLRHEVGRLLKAWARG